MRYHSGEDICLGDRVAYNGQQGFVALKGDEKRGCCGMKRQECEMADCEILVVFDNGARAVVDQPEDDDYLVLLCQGAKASQ